MYACARLVYEISSATGYVGINVLVPKAYRRNLGSSLHLSHTMRCSSFGFCHTQRPASTEAVPSDRSACCADLWAMPPRKKCAGEDGRSEVGSVRTTAGRLRGAGKDKSKGRGRGRVGALGKAAARKGQKGPAIDSTLEESRSFLKQPEMQIDANISWGSVLTCDICLKKSDEEPWGRTVRMKKANESGMGDQPVGPSCQAHYLFHGAHASWMTWGSFVDLYHSDALFKDSVNEGVANMAEAKANEGFKVDYLQERVTENDEVKIEFTSPACYLLKAAEFAKEFHSDPREGKEAKSVTLPPLDGSNGEQQFFLAAKAGAPQYPTARVIRTFSGKRSRLALEPGQHIFQSEGRRLFEHLGELRSEATGRGLLSSATDGLPTLAAEAPDGHGSQASLAPAAAEASHRRPVGEAVGSAGQANPNAIEEEGLIITGADGRSRMSFQSPPAKMPRMSVSAGSSAIVRSPSFAGSVAGGRQRPPTPSLVAKARGSVTDSPIADLDGGSVTGSVVDDEAGEQGASSKTDYWIAQNCLDNVLLGHALGVQEHQAELRLKKMEKHSAENPGDKRFASEIARLKSHMRKVSVCKRLRPAAIIHLTDDELGVALMALGGSFEFPSATQANMVIRRAGFLRSQAMAAVDDQARSSQWEVFCEILRPAPLGSKPEFVPLEATLAGAPIKDNEAAKILRAEVVENTLVPMVMTEAENGCAQLHVFCSTLLKVFESLWDEFGHLTTKVLCSMVSNARGIAFLTCGSSLLDEEILEDLKHLQAGATATEGKTIRNIVGTAVFANELWADRLETHLRAEKNCVIAGPLLKDMLEQLEGFAENATDKGHFDLLVEAARYMVAWSPKLPAGSLDMWGKWSGPMPSNAARRWRR